MSSPLTVLQILPELNVGGVERGTIQVARALEAAGHRALVVSGGGRLVPELEACGARHITLDVGKKSLKSLRHILRLRRLFSEHHVDVVHARSRLPAWLAKFALGRNKPGQRPAWVTTVHGPYTVNRYSRIMVSGDVVIAISQFIRDYILHNYPAINPARIEVIARGVDRDRYYSGYTPSAAWQEAWRAAHPQLAGRKLLTLPARLTRWKGQLEFIEMIHLLRQEGLPVHGLLAGAAHRRKSAFERELRRRVNALGLIDDVTFLGQREDLRDVLAISDVVYSLTNEPEAFGRTSLEALSLGVPVIGYAHGGTREVLATIFQQGLIAKGDLRAATACTRQLLAARPTIATDHPYTVERQTAATLALYSRLIERQRASANNRSRSRGAN